MCLGKKEFKSGKHTWKFKILSMPKTGPWGNCSLGITKVERIKHRMQSLGGFNGFGISCTAQSDFTSHVF